MEREAIPELAPVVAANPTTATVPAAAPAVPSRTMPTPSPAEPQPEATAEATPAPTPMLDAALRRAEAAEDDRARTLRAIATAQPIPPEPASEPEVAPAPAPEPTSDPAPTTTAEPAPAAPPMDVAVKPASVEVEVPVEATEPEKTPEPRKTPEPESAPIEPQPEPEAKSVESEASLPTPISDEPPPLTIGAVQLCRKINGFGSFEPLNARALRPGKSALVYCELVGLEYRPEAEGFASHVATRVELIRPGNGEKAWEVSGEAADRCRTKRRDSYVATLITLPDSIAPGPYTLRLYQADAANGRTASAEIPVTIAR